MQALIRAQECSATLAFAPKRYIAPPDADDAIRPVCAAAGIDEATCFSAVTSRAGLEALEGEWNDLFARAGRDIHVFQTFNWIWHWSRHFLADAKAGEDRCDLYIVTGRRGGRLVLIWPLVRQKRAGLTVLGFAGEPISQYGDLIVEDGPGVKSILDNAWTFVTRHSGADVLSLRKVRADSNLASLLEGKGALVTEHQIAPFVDLASAPDYETYELRYSARSRRNRRRLLRRFEEREPACINHYRSGNRASELAALAVSLKRAWVKDRGLVSPALNKSATLAFFQSVASDGERPVAVNITSLETQGEAAAVEVAFDCKGRRVLHIVVFSLKFERAGVGQLLLDRALRAAKEDGIDVYDLMAPGDAYKFDWSDASVEVLDWAHGLTPRGRAYAWTYLAHGRKLLKRTVLATTGFIRRLLRRKPSDRAGE